MDSHNFSSETNSIFVVQESSTEAKHEFEVCAENSVIHLEGGNDSTVNSSASSNKFDVGNDHSYGNINKTIEVSLKNENNSCKDNSASKENSLDDSGEMNVTVTIHDNLICSIEEGKPNTPRESEDGMSCTITEDKDGCEGEQTSTSPAIISKNALAKDEEDSSSKNVASLSQQITDDTPQKVFKPISITSVKSLKITKPDNLNRDRLIVNPIFCDQVLKNRNIRRSEAWNHFKRLNSLEVECNFCKGKFSCQSGSSNLLKHLRNKHQNEMLSDGKLKDELETVGSCFDSPASIENVQNKLTDKKRVKKVSKIWKYFSKSKLGKVNCKICFKIIPYRSSNSLLVRHLRLKHVYIYGCILNRSSKFVKKYQAKNTSAELQISDSSKSSKHLDLKSISTELNHPLDISGKGKVNYHPATSFNECNNLNSNKQKRKLSESWKYFTKLQFDKIKCNICEKTLKYIEGVSSNLTRHLKGRHVSIYSKNNVQESQRIDIQPFEDGNQNEKFEISSINCNEIQIKDGNDFDDDKNVTKIRKYFSKFNSGQVKCNVCQVILTHTPGMTFNLKCHIILKHKNIFEKIVKAIYIEENEYEKVSDNVDTEYKKIKLNWKYFTKMKSGKLKCNLCTEMPSFYCSTYESLLHLRLKHNITLDSNEEQSVVSFIELNDKDPYDDKTEGTEDSGVRDSKETGAPESVGIFKTDRTWKFFSKIYQDKVIEVRCNLCDEIFSYTRGVTSSLTNHLNTVHKDKDFINETNSKVVEEFQGFDNIFEGSDSAHYPVKTSLAAKRAFCKKSRVWEYFTVTEQFKAQCNICFNVLTFSPRSSSNLSRHLKRRHGDIYNFSNEELTQDNNEEQHNVEFQCTSVEDIDDKSSLEVKSIFDFLKEDLKLKHCIKFESDVIKCNFCLNPFLCQDVDSYLHVLQEHMQINHAEWQVACLENINSRKQASDEEPDRGSSNYNELEAIAHEIQSYSLSDEKISQDNSNKKESNEATNGDLNNSQNDIYKNVWKYFTKLTSQNVRCNFCCTLLLFRNNKKWNLYRHLRLKHLSKLKEDDAFFYDSKPDVKKVESQDNNFPLTKSPDSLVKRDSPQKKNTNSDTTRSSCRKNISSDDSSVSENDEKEEEKESRSKTEVKPVFTPRTGRTWSHFTKVEMGKATCNVCHKSIHYSGTGLDVLNKHLTRCYKGNSATKRKVRSENLSLKLSETNYQKSKLRSSIACRRSTRFSGGNSNKDNEKSCELNKKTDTSSDALKTGRSVDNSFEEDKNDRNVDSNSDVDSENCEDTAVNEQVETENEIVSKTNSLSENTFINTRNEVRPYYTVVGDGVAKCHLCLLRIPYKDKAVTLMRHLRRIHSVITVGNPFEEQTVTRSDNKKEKSQLLAAINLAPNKLLENESKICFTKLGKKTAKCNFCSKMIWYKNSDISKLSSHLLQTHCGEIFSCNELMLKHVKIFAKSDDISLSPNDLRSANLNQLKLNKDLMDQNDMPNNKRSITWLYYKKLDGDYAECNICNKALSYKGGSVYNLTRHLFMKHNIKLNKFAALDKHKASLLSVKTVPKIFNFYKKKSNTLSFYTKINRYFVKCKLCYKHFIYKGVNINRLINHLWSAHIAKLIDFNYGPSHSSSDLIESNVQREANNSPMENYIKDTAEVIYQSMSHNIRKRETRRRPKISNTWKYYSKNSTENFKAKCNICLKYFSFKNGNVSNLSKHLFRNHGIKLLKKFGSKGDKEIYGNLKNSGEENPKDFREISLMNVEKLENPSSHPSIRSVNDVNKPNVNMEKNNDIDVWKYMKMIDDEVECNFCDQKFVFENGLVSQSILRNHLFLHHRVKPSSFVQPLADDKDRTSLIGEPFAKKVKKKLFHGKHFLNKNKKFKSSFARLKCKLCYRYLIVKEHKTEKLVEHLSSHQYMLSEEEYAELKEFRNSHFIGIDSNTESKNDTDGRLSIKSDLNENLIFKHFKSINSTKNKCKICHKFISSKIHCTHHITNDVLMTYGLMKNRSLKGEPSSKKTAKRVNNDTFKLYGQKRFKNFLSSTNGNHFLNVNSCENKCGSCNLSPGDKGYCTHSLNQWLNEKQLESSENPSGSDCGIRMKDELEIISDALSDGENKIIIITDDGAPSILNYDGTNKNENESDVSYHVINVDGENNDDIQVVIYNFDPEEGEKSIDQQADGGKIEELKDSAGSTQTCNKELEEQVKVILQELNNANVFSNQVQRKCKNVSNTEDEKPFAEKVSVIQQPEASIEKEKGIVTEEKPLKQIFEDLGNKKKVEVQPIPVSETLPADFMKKEISDHSANLISKLQQSESLESFHKKEDSNSEPVNKGELLAVEICNNVSSKLIETDEPKESEFEVKKVPDENACKKINVRNFDEAIVNFEECAAEFNSIDTNIYKDDGIEINSGMLLQNLNGFHKINRNLIYFSNIDYTFKTAKCNICNSNLIFENPIIYNLMGHLYSIHKSKMVATNGFDTTGDENCKKILDLLKRSNDNNVCAAKPTVKPRRKSLVWKYFINDADYRATCKICHFNFSYKGGAVNNLGRHLRLRHNVHIPTRNVVGHDSHFENYDDVDLKEFNHFPMLPKKRTYVKLRSKTWNYFSKEPNDWAKCILCKRYLSYRSSTINNLTRHLRTVHADIYSCLFTEKEILVDDGSGNSDVMNDDVFKSVLLETAASRSRDEVLQECSYGVSDQSGTKRTSVVWNYFSEVNRDSGRCNFCSKLISCKGGGTSNLSRHLRVKHGIWIVLTSTLAKKYEEQYSNDIENNETNFLLNQNSDPSLTPYDKIITHEELQYLKTKKPESKKSKTWDYFIKETPDKVVCKICSKVLSYKCKAVHNLRRHLAIKHPDCIGKREPVRLKLQIDEKESATLKGENDEQSITDRKYIDITNSSVVIIDEEIPPPMRKSDRTSRPKKSLVWNYFIELEYGIAKCNLCSKVLSFRGGGTNNLMRHLRSQHAIIIDLQVAEDSGFLTSNDPNTNNDVNVTNEDSKFILGY